MKALRIAFFIACMSAAAAHADTANAPALADAQHAITTHGYSPSRLLALGRAQLQAGQLGPAILSFERGLVLAPRDAELHASLARAEQTAGIARGEQTWPMRALHLLSMREWAFVACGGALSFSIACLGLVLATRLRVVFGTILALGGLTGALGAIGVASLRDELARAVVLVPDGALLQSPFSNATIVAHVRGGEAVELRERHGDFVYVESEQGASGWMQHSAVAPIAAPEPPRT
jgi:hypothetical protein